MYQSALHTQIVGSCLICQGGGKLRNAVGEMLLCNCLVKFRAYNRLLGSGFCDEILDFVSSDDYTFPKFESGEEFINYFVNSPAEILAKGLSLFIFSSEKGRGKTTLAHYLTYSLAKYFQRTENYARDRSYGFETAQNLQLNFDAGNGQLWQSTIYVLDDLGAEAAESSWKKEAFLATLQQVMHYRRDNKLPTIITTNYPPKFIAEKYQHTLDSLLEIRPDGSIGRGKVFRAVEVGGAEDLRLMDDRTDWPI
jgi:hypothetical protein